LAHASALPAARSAATAPSAMLSFAHKKAFRPGRSLMTAAAT
jgi:hypothetical protein